VPSVDWSSLIGAYVLLIEDDRDARLSLQELLDEWGVLYSSGASLAEILEGDEDSERLVDAIICDYRLPGGTNGVECVEQIRARLGYAPGAVLITGEPEPDTVRARAGPDTVVLHKPFAPSALALPLVEAVRAARIAERQ